MRHAKHTTRTGVRPTVNGAARAERPCRLVEVTGPDQTDEVVPIAWANPAPEDGRNHMAPSLGPFRMSLVAPEPTGPIYPVGEAVENLPRRIKSPRLPVRSALLIVIAQAALGAAVAANTMPALIGVAVMVSCLLAGGCMVVAECLWIVSNRRQ